MKKLLLALLVALMGISVYADAAKSLTFPAVGGEKINAYTKEWTATVGEDVWTIFGFNTNNNGWNHIRCGQKKVDQEAWILSPAFDMEMGTMVIKVVQADNVVKVTLTTLNGGETVATEDVTDKFVVGDVKLPLTAGKGYAYKLTINSASGANGSTRIESIELFEAGAVLKKAAELAFSESSVSVDCKKLSEFVAPEFTKATTAAITWASDNADVATVDANGAVTLTGTQGTAKITASAAENDEYEAGEATYTINVEEYVYYTKATELKEGVKYVMVFAYGENLYYATPLTGKYGTLRTYTVKGADVRISTKYDNTFTFANTENGYTITQSDGRMLYMSGNYNNFNVADEAPSAQYWTITTNEDGTYSMLNVEKNKTIMLDATPNYPEVGSFAADNQPEKTALPMLYVEASDTPDAITGVEADTNVRAGIYTITGQRVSKAQHGLYIINGKKVLVK